MADHETIIYLAKLAEKAECYEGDADMATEMKKMATMGEKMTEDEEYLLLRGYDQVIMAQEASWKLLTSNLKKQPAQGWEHTKVVLSYMQKVETEICDICKDLLSIINQHLIPSASTPKSSVFYLKLRGDYYWTLAEYSTGVLRTQAVQESLNAYEVATFFAKVHLSPTDPLRLCLAMLYSTIYYEMTHSTSRAIKVAKQTYDAAISVHGRLDEEPTNYSTLFMLKLKDNLEIYNSGISGDDNVPPAA